MWSPNPGNSPCWDGSTRSCQCQALSSRTRPGSARSQVPARYRTPPHGSLLFRLLREDGSAPSREGLRPRLRFSWHMRCPRKARSHTLLSPPPVSPPPRWTRLRSARWGVPVPDGWRCGSGSPRERYPPFLPADPGSALSQNRSVSPRSHGMPPQADCLYTLPCRQCQ